MKLKDLEKNYKKGAVYCIYCSKSDMYYIGSTCQEPYSDRMYGRLPSSHVNRSKNDNSPLYRDMRKFGVDNFEFIILEESFEDIKSLEYEYLEMFSREFGKSKLYNKIYYDGEQFQSKEVRDKVLNKLRSKSYEERRNSAIKSMNTCREKYGYLPYNTKESHDKSVRTQLGKYGSYKNHPVNSKESHIKSAKSSHRSRSNIFMYEGKEYEGLVELTEYLQKYYPGISQSSVSRISRGINVKSYPELVGKIIKIKQSSTRY